MKRVASFFGRQETSIGSAAGVMMTMVLTSRILGLIRDRLLNARFDPKTELDVYIAAFRIPNFFFDLMVMGALTAAFIPVFSKYVSEKRDRDAMKMTSMLINLSLLLFFILTVPAFIWADHLCRILVPGFSPEKITLMTQITRFIILFQVPPLIIGNYFTGILQSYNRFIIPAIAPVVYNVGTILAIIFLSGTYGIFAPVVGIGIGALLFCLLQVPLVIRLGYKHTLSADLDNPGVREVGKLMGPRMLGIAGSEIDATVDQMMASLVGAGMVTYFSYAQQLQQVPVSLFGQTIAQAALPTLAVSSQREDKSQFKETITMALHQILFFVLPIATLFIILRIPIVRLIFGASRFGWDATVITGMTLSAFSLSLAFQAMNHVLTRGFYATLDTKTPVILSLITIGLNTVLSVIFVLFLHWPVWALGLSTSVATILNCLLLFVFLDRRVGGFAKFRLLWSPFKMLIASGITGVMLYVPLKLFDQLVFDTTRTFGLIFLTGTVGGIGFVTYFFLAWVLDVNEVHSVIALLSRVHRPKAVILEPVSEVVTAKPGDSIA